MHHKKTKTRKNFESRILVVENDDELGQKISGILTNAGYEICRLNTFFGALATLENPEEKPFAVIIATYKMPTMTGDELLKNAKSIAPDTQRVLIIESPDISNIMSAVNRAGIHSCIVLPFTDELFLSEITQRYKHFNQIKKKERLLKITRHQNKQLYQTALKLKEKNDSFTRQIKKKKNLLQVLKKKEEKILTEQATYSLKKLLELKGMEISPKVLLKEFESLTFKVKYFLNDVCSLTPTGSEKSENTFLENNDETIENNTFAVNAYGTILERFADAPHPEDVLKDLISQEPWLDTDLIDLFLSAFLESEVSNARRYNVTTCDSPSDASAYEEKFMLTVSEDSLSASIQRRDREKASDTYTDLQNIKALLEKNTIRYGICEDTVIEDWLMAPPDSKEIFIIAQGTAPLKPINASINFFFDIDFLHAGKLKSDGTMDFRDRGSIPYVNEGTLLAEKKNYRNGSPGMDIYGNNIPVAPPEDIIFKNGNNTRISDDNLKIYATAEGQPYLDAMGIISVYPELCIEGDVGYETGNIDFDGNLVVSGTVKEGFSVRCANLTVAQIHGAEINITGNLNVSAGIIDSNVINVQGHIQAKYVNNSTVKGFGNIIVQKEIIDSQVYTGGKCINENGSILSSNIFAKGGVRANTVGTPKASKSKIEIGTEKLMDMIIAELDQNITKNNDEIEVLQKTIEGLENKERSVLERISNYAYEQDLSQTKLRELQQKAQVSNALKDIDKNKNSLETMKELQQKINKAEEVIDEYFKLQDGILEQLRNKKQNVEKLENANKEIVYKKRAMREYNNRTKAKSELIVKRSIVGGTLIQGNKSRLFLTDDLRRCRIHEVRINDGASVSIYEIRISNITN